MTPEPLKNKSKHIYQDYWYFKFHEVKSSVEWLLSKKLGDKLKAVDFEGKEMLVFYKEDFDRAFEDVI